MSRKEQKKLKGKIRLAVLLILIIAIIVTIVIVNNNKNKAENNNNNSENEVFVEENEAGIKVNTSEELSKTKTFYGYEISATTLEETNGESTLVSTIKNTTDSAIGEEFVNIAFKAKNGEEIYKMEVYLPEIQPGETISLNSTITEDVIGAYNIELVK